MNKKEDKINQILVAAGECFRRYGYKKTTLDDIGEIVGLDKSSLYYYFKNKEEIFIKLKTTQYAEYMKKLNETMADQNSCEQKILNYFEKKHELWYQESQVLPYLTKEDIHKFITIGDEEVTRINDLAKIQFAKELKKCIDKGEIQYCDETKITSYIFALVDGIMANYREIDTMRPVTESESNLILSDTISALKIFVAGLVKK